MTTLFINNIKNLKSSVQNVTDIFATEKNINNVVNFLSQVIFVFVLFLGMIMSANEVETKEK